MERAQSRRTLRFWPHARRLLCGEMAGLPRFRGALCTVTFMFRVEHDWQLIKTTVTISGPGKSELPSIKWVCGKCGSVVFPTAEQVKWNTYRRPNKKRKFEGMYCGELVINGIHES